MKTSTVLVVAVLFGGAAGVALAYLSVGPPGGPLPVATPLAENASDPAANSAAADPEAPPNSVSPTSVPSISSPKAVVDKDVHEFGTMLLGTTESHRFEVRNEGTAPLTLSVGRTSCKCTLGEVADGPIPPGGSAPVLLEWTAKALPGHFRQSATVHTNDPSNLLLRLTVQGVITEIGELSSSTLDLGAVDVDAGGAASLYVKAYDSDDLRVTAEMSGEVDHPELFHVSVEPTPPDEAPGEGARSAARITVTADPGLPTGPVNEWVSVKTNLEGRESFLVPVIGRVRGAIVVRGRTWNDELGLLNLGVVTSSEGGSSRLLLSCSGPMAESIEYEVASVDPPELLAELGERRSLRQGVSHTPLEVRVPPGTRPMVRVRRADVGDSSGNDDAVILLKTNHPTSREMKLRVRFIVQG